MWEFFEAKFLIERENLSKVDVKVRFTRISLSELFIVAGIHNYKHLHRLSFEPLFLRAQAQPQRVYMMQKLAWSITCFLYCDYFYSGVSNGIARKGNC
jgi:hypothetical protein